MSTPDLNLVTMACDLILEINWGGLRFLYMGHAAYRICNKIKDTLFQKPQSIVYID